MNVRRTVSNTILAAVSAIGVTFAPPVSAQSYPNRPIIMIVPFPPGGIADSSARIVAAAVPTITETVPGVTTSTWIALFAPHGTPKSIIDRLNQASTKVLQSSDLREKLAGIGIVAKPGTPDELGGTAQADLDFWRKAIATAGLEQK